MQKQINIEKMKRKEGESETEYEQKKFEVILCI